MVDRSRFGKKVKKVKKPEQIVIGQQSFRLLNNYLSGNTTEFQCPNQGLLEY